MNKERFKKQKNGQKIVKLPIFTKREKRWTLDPFGNNTGHFFVLFVLYPGREIVRRTEIGLSAQIGRF